MQKKNDAHNDKNDALNKIYGQGTIIFNKKLYLCSRFSIFKVKRL